MAYSFVKYTGDGTTTDYSIPFPYLSKDYLEVKVNKVLTTAYTLPTASTLKFNTAPANSLIVEIRRNTPKGSRLVDFQDASILTEAALDLSADQALHVAQETFDLATDGAGLAAAASAEAAAASYDSFDDRYLGAKAADPTLDNDGNALLVGALYFNTATTAFRAWNGTVWNQFAVNAQLTTLGNATAQQATDLASISAFVGTVMNDATSNDVLTTLTATRAEAGATAVTVLNALRRVVSVKDFGAVGDGAADDTTKIQAALDAVGTTGGAVFFPLGVYKTTATLKFGSGTTLQGLGIDSLIKGASVAAPLFQSTGGTAARRYRLVIRDLGIDNTTTVAGGVGLDLRNVSDSKLDNVFISNVEMGVQFYADAGLGCYYNTLKDVSVASCVKGFWFGALANENRLIACRTNGTTEPVVLADGSHNSIISCAFEVFTTGINISGPAYDTLILSPRLENAPTAGIGIKVVSTAVHTTIIAPQYTGLTTNLDDAATNSVILSGQDGFKFGEVGAKTRFHKKATASLNFPSIAANSTADLSIAMAGVVATDTVSVTPDAAVPGGVMFMAIPGAGLAYVRAANVTAAAIDLAAFNFTIDAWGN